MNEFEFLGDMLLVMAICYGGNQKLTQAEIADKFTRTAILNKKKTSKY